MKTTATEKNNDFFRINVKYYLESYFFVKYNAIGYYIYGFYNS